ncbi:transmembrane protein 244 isoform X1 [Camelus ferus]|uniref:Transmembrane protein 244 isoform X1 n=1 Tax=Camelus ferus TaxID=419612 RepID=A0A8B8TF19_CAMFR|nr:transmembrane protein 244 isoform X1 [Camelus ferus]
MALQVRVAPSKVVLQNLLLCVILFYTVYYVVLGMCSVMFKVYELDVLAPFDFKTNPSWLNTNYKVLFVSTEVTYFTCGLLFVLVVEEWVWDYGISVTILHVAITSTSKQNKIKETKCVQSGGVPKSIRKSRTLLYACCSLTAK